MKKNVYEKMPWNSLDEYFELGMKFGAWGTDLKNIVMKENRKPNLIPIIKEAK